MAEQLLFIADNLFDVRQYPGHTVSGDSEPTGTEAFHVGDGRRDVGTSRWQPSGANATHYAQVTCNVVRGADFLAIDRESNLISNVLAGNASQVSLLGSSDSFATTRTVASVTLPGAPGGAPSETAGCVTDEGAWLKTFTLDAFYQWRLTTGAMGSGVTPRITGLMLGKCWAPSITTVRAPHEDECFTISCAETPAPSGWVGSAKYAVTRSGVIHIKQISEADYDLIRWQVLGLYAYGFPAWVMYRKTDYPWRAMLIQCPKADLRWLRDDQSWLHSRTLDIPYREVQPVWN